MRRELLAMPNQEEVKSSSLEISSPKEKTDPVIVLNFMYSESNVLPPGISARAYLEKYQAKHPNAVIINIGPEDFNRFGTGDFDTGDEEKFSKVRRILAAQTGRKKIKVFGHGAENYGYIKQDGMFGRKFSAKQVAQVIGSITADVNDDELLCGEVSVLSCSSAQGKNSFAHQLSDELHKTENNKKYRFLVKGAAGLISVGGTGDKYNLTPGESLIIGHLQGLQLIGGITLVALGVTGVLALPALGLIFMAGLIVNLAVMAYIRAKRHVTPSNKDQKVVLTRDENGKITETPAKDFVKPKYSQGAGYTNMNAGLKNPEVVTSEEVVEKLKNVLENSIPTDNLDEEHNAIRSLKDNIISLLDDLFPEKKNNTNESKDNTKFEQLMAGFNKLYESAKTEDPQIVPLMGSLIRSLHKTNGLTESQAKQMERAFTETPTQMEGELAENSPQMERAFAKTPTQMERGFTKTRLQQLQSWLTAPRDPEIQDWLNGSDKNSKAPTAP
jgi:hypothetical protein